MTDAEREPWNCRAKALPKAMPKMNVDAETAADCTSGQSAWGIGSSSYPCASEVIHQTVNGLLPEGRTWLRRAYDECLACPRSDLSAKCRVSNTTGKTLNVNRLRARRKGRQTCWQTHPGLCASHELFSSILALHGTMTRALKAADLCAADDDGQTLILLVGYSWKRDAEA